MKTDLERASVGCVLLVILAVLTMLFGGCVASREANSGSVRVSVDGLKGASVTGPLVSVAVQMYSSDTATEQTLSKEVPVSLKDAAKLDAGGLLP